MSGRNPTRRERLARRKRAAPLGRTSRHEDRAPRILPPVTSPPLTSAEVAKAALVEALGSSVTPFVPLPLVDDWIVRRLLRRVAKKTTARHGVTDPAPVARRIVKGYVRAGKAGWLSSIANVTTRFVVRKVAVALDVKKSHDVFSEVIAFALALEIAAERGWHFTVEPEKLGGACLRAVRGAGGGLTDAIGKAGRAAFSGNGTEGSRVARATEAIAQELDARRSALGDALERELPAR